MLRITGICALALVTSLALSAPVSAQSADYCTGLCGGKVGGEAANPPHVVACYRKCMGMTPGNDSQSKSRKSK